MYAEDSKVVYTPTRLIRVFLVLAAVAIALPALAGAQKSVKIKKIDPKSKMRKVSPKAEAVPLAVFADIERGWRKADVSKILVHFGKRKVAISIAGAGPAGGYFSRNQSFYLFKDLFKYTITKRFEFTQYRNIHDGNRKVYAVAERHYKRRDDGRLFKDKIYVSLERENGRWVVSEIKSIR